MKEIAFAPQEIGNVEDIHSYISAKSGRKNIRIIKSFIDARHKNDVKIIYRIDNSIPEDNEKTALPHLGKKINSVTRPVVVGFGPAGMFAGLILARYGLNPIIIEKGKAVPDREADVNSYCRENGSVNPDSNIQFGEGGAGTFSDGKLYTGVSSGLKGFIAEEFVKHGAPDDIMYDSHPHVGTDNLRNVVIGIRKEIESLGGEIRFGSNLEALIVKEGRIKGVVTGDEEIITDMVFLGIGHSSRKTFEYLFNNNIAMENKPFAVGVRIEHLRYDIDMAQYGFDTSLYKNISAANYKLAVDTSTGKKLYTFCMCPGGVVVPAASSAETICTNGMSYRARDAVNSNSALLIPVDPSDYGEGVLAGMRFQEKIERNAFLTGEGKAPVIRYGDLISGKLSMPSTVTPSYARATAPSDMKDIFSAKMIETLKDGISIMGRKIRCFSSEDAVLTAVEARSSSPVRILRNRETFESISCRGLYPIGEGAGYAGGIMSSAIDGIKSANQAVQSMVN